MGAVLGLAAYGRTQEKLAGANNGGLGAGTTYTAPTPIVSGGFSNGNTTAPATGSPSGIPAPSAPASSGFANSSFGATPTPASSTTFTPVPSWGTTPTAAVDTTGGGKKIVPDFGQPAI
jgi:hypothetical protein